MELLPTLAALALVLLAARLGGALFERLRLPAVLGELIAGVVLGNLGWVGLHGFDALRDSRALEWLAEIGVLFLLFAVGLDSDVRQMLAVGPSALLVALIGVAAPLLLGFGVSRLFHPGQEWLVHAFVGATLCATSVGITARVLGDLRHTTSLEGRIILGAAVIDDVLGLIVLAVVAGAIEATNAGGAFAPATALVVTAKAVGFLLAAVLFGRPLSRALFAWGSRLAGSGQLLGLALALCFGLAWAAGRFGLAPIVGAFAAGLVIEAPHVRALVARDPLARDLHAWIEPLSGFLVPVFFVRMGMLVNVAAFAGPGVLGFAAALTAVAVLGKQACSLGVLDKGADRLAVGLGMIPRGEVGLIFASIGASLTLHGAPVVDGPLVSAVVLMVAVTTLVTPPLLAWRLRRNETGARR
ncbi:MAG TPA: cation:proton antiporter [Candidatus Saccharimonadaceae bacterium]|nr:cation:proton antiporter [Candidatus Saccharimonadaceae bacterium]